MSEATKQREEAEKARAELSRGIEAREAAVTAKEEQLGQLAENLKRKAGAMKAMKVKAESEVKAVMEKCREAEERAQRAEDKVGVILLSLDFVTFSLSASI